ncbi:BT_3987 domain-containing protein [Haoranjiania flava]|uniref:DUF1735 domain-containing protein n=1 Tax=Haoranjiania flava TaxID=1856322 RepID=A0AAE3IK22_9BACT|nr:DUF1735 domain-containing protein [Haoranjiania flava]MCU7693562.1 DUF1735 domain-containing protein [Haoranjiania flava]
MNTYFKICLMGWIAIFTLPSCEKDREITLPNEGTIYMPQAVNNRDKLQILFSQKPQNIYFGAAYGGMSYPDSDITANFSVDPALVEKYNLEHNTGYQLLPDSTYILSGLSTVIKAGQINSEPLFIALTTKKVDRHTKYMLPVKMTSVSTGKLDTALHTAFFRFDAVVRPERDITNSGSLAVSHENNGGPDAGEGSKKLVDGDYSSKFLIFDIKSKMPFGFQLTFQNPVKIGAYTFTSGNDAPDRDPKNWMLQGSADGNNWTTLDSRSDEKFSSRNQTRRFEFENETQYKFYRIVVTEINGGGLFQMSEWRVIEYYEL